MSSNRYVSIKPQEFVQTYDPYPFEEMYKMAQYKQGRADQASLVAGKLAGEANIESGYFTGDPAKQIMKEREADVNRLNEIAASGNVAATTRAYAEALTRWQKNPMLESVNSDLEQKKFVDAQMAREGYGNDYMFTTYDSNTGQFTPSEATKAKIASGQKLTLQDYGGIENVADIKAFQPYIQLIEPKVLQGYTLVEDPITGEQKYKETNGTEELTYNIVKERSKGVLEGFKNDDGTINMELLRSTDPEMYKNARWKEAAYAREGRGGQFKWDNLVDDYMNIASLSFYTKGKQNITGVGGDSGSSKKITEADLMAGNVPINYFTAENDPSKPITNMREAAINLGINPITGEDKAIGMNVSELIYTPPSGVTPEERLQYDNQYSVKQQQYTTKMYNIELDKLKKQYPDKVVNGVTISTKDPLEIEREARSISESNMRSRNKIAHAMFNTQTQLDPTKIPSKDNLKKSESYFLENNKDILGMVHNIFNLGITKSKDEREQFFKKYPNVAKSVAHPYYDETDIRNKDEITKGIIKVNDEYILNNQSALLEEMKNFTYSPGVKYAGQGTQYTNKELDKLPKRSYYDEYNRQIEIKKNQFFKKDYEEYYSTLDKNIEEAFKAQEITTTGILLLNKSGEFSEAEIPFYHKIVSKAAIERVASGAGMYYNGKPLTAFNTNDSNSTKGHVKQDLFIAGGDGTDEAKTADFSAGVFLPAKFYFNNSNNKWFARGNFSATDEDGKPIKSSDYDVDISENMDEFLSFPAQDEVFTTDRAIDILNSTYKGTATVARFGGPKEEVEKYGAMKVYGNPDGTYAISGKIPNESGEVKNIQEVLRDRGENPLSLAKDKAAEYLGDAFKYRVSAIRKDKFVKQEGIAIEVPEAYLSDVSNIFKTIGYYESGGNTGEYNAMNQGSYDAEGTKPKNPGNSFNIIGKRIVDMTVGEVIKHQALPQDDPQRIHAVGKLQFTGPTFKEFVEKAGISHDEKMTPATQQKLGLALIREEVQNAISRGNDRDYLKGRLKSRWVGLRNASDQQLESLIDSAMIVGSNL